MEIPVKPVVRNKANIAGNMIINAKELALHIFHFMTIVTEINSADHLDTRRIKIEKIVTEINSADHLDTRRIKLKLYEGHFLFRYTSILPLLFRLERSLHLAP